MKIYGYTQTEGVFAKPTGVGKHIDQMFNGLARRPGVDFTMLLAADQSPDGSPLAELPVARIPHRRRLLEWAWTFTARPRLDRYCPHADWIYCPFERGMASDRHRVATTVHSLYWFDRSLPGYDGWRMPRMKFRLMLAKMRRHSDVVLTVSEFLKGQLVDWFGFAAEKVVVVGNGAEPEFFEAARRPGAAPPGGGRPYVVVVSGLNYLDGARYVLPVARALLELDPDIEVRVAGHQNEPEYVGEAKTLPNVKLLGYQRSAELAELMHGSVALLFLNRYETFGLGVVEAMAAGTPVIGTNFTAVPEIVRGAGIIANPEDPGETARTVVDLARSPSSRQRYIRLGTERVQDFTWAACLERLVTSLSQPARHG